MKSFSRKIKLGGLGLLAASAVALATVTFDPNTGTGFVGKGDVQAAFGLTNAQLQTLFTNCSTSDQASCPVDFTYESTTHYLATCTFTTGEGTRGEKVHNIDIPRHAGVRGSVAYDARRANQVTGFNLTNFDGDVVSQGTVPVVGEPCVGPEGSAGDGTWTEVVVTGTDSTGLEACIQTVSVTGKGRNQTRTITETCVTIWTPPVPPVL